MYNALTIGGGHGGIATRLLAWGLGWEDSSTLANLLTGICRVVHAPTLAWKVAPVSFVPRAVLAASIPKVVNAPFIPRVSQSEAISRVMVSVPVPKAIKASWVSRVHVAPSSPVKCVQPSFIPKVQVNTQADKTVIQTEQGKVVK